MSAEPDEAREGTTKGDHRDWTKYFWKIVVDCTMLSAVSSIMFFSVMSDPFGIARAGRITKPFGENEAV